MKIGFLFPGQGSQSIGMGKDLYDEYEEIKKVYDKVKELTNIDIAKISFEGPEEVLNETKHTQLAILTMSLGILEILKKHNISADIEAGLSLGEYTALIDSKVLSFEEGVKLVQKRGECMQELLPEGNWQMAAVIGLEDEQVEDICKNVKLGFVVPANYNSIGQVAISGEESAVQEAKELAIKNGAKRVLILKTAGPFHTSKLIDASKVLRKELEKVNQELESGMSEESIQNLEKLIATNVATIEKLTKTNTELKTAYETYHLKDMTYEEALKTDITLYNVKMNYENMYESNTQLIVLLTTNNQALEETLTSIKGMQQKVEQLIKTLNVYLGQLESGAKSLSDGTDKLKEGVTIITSKTKELKNGTTELKSGIDTLQKGVHEFNKDGITPITQFLDNDVREVTNKIEVLMKLSEEYQTFTLKPDKVNGNTRFVSVIDSITIPKEIKKVEKKQEKESFWDRVKNLFK